ncbi:MAG: hypothetical protein AB1671_24360 [Thermodesulfobacteriota bacterium]|jgi:hypothetical protein
MKSLEQHLLPDRNAFSTDPFGYSALAWQKWAVAQSVAGLPADPQKPPTSQDLKSPVLWLGQAHALSEAARIVLLGEPNLNHLPILTRGVCDSQYCAVGLMLVGYSLEVCPKAMLILRKGIDVYTSKEREHKHHKLEKLSEFIPDLNEKDKAILGLLTHFVLWAGRYPDPGFDRESDAERIFTLSEKYQISASDLFRLATYVMGHVKVVTG